MNRTILFPIFAAITLLIGTVAVNVNAQNVTQNANQTGEKAQAAMNETGEAFSNVTGNVIEGIKDVFNGSSK